ncbi:MAG: hypothetical protein ACK6CU_30960 [Deltaproteobacteria bacterium]|jgi:hypothetical protein
MSPEDDELAAWRASWQALGDTEDLAADLALRAKRDARLLHRAAAAQVLASALAILGASALALRSSGRPENLVLLALIALFCGVWLALFFSSRASVFASDAEGLDAFVRLTRKRLAVELRWCTTARRATAALCVALAPWGGWLLWRRWDLYAEEPWRAVVGFGGAALVVGLVVWGLGHRERGLREVQRRLEERLDQASLRQAA